MTARRDKDRGWLYCTAVAQLTEPITRARILIVDDQAPNIRLLERLLTSAGYHRLYSTTVPEQVPALAGQVSPDLILLDLHMPGLDGFGVMEQLQPRLNEERYLPILVVTADLRVDVRLRARGAGARDFLNKPFDAVEALLRIRNLLTTRFLYLQLDKHNRGLEATVQERTRKLEVARLEILERLALAAEFRDDNTGEHTRRVGRLAGAIARDLGLAEDVALTIERAAPLHDVGKIGIRDAILLKPGPLTPSEYEEMKRHTVIGADILSGSRGALLRTAEEIALTHHERWDGAGYPRGLRGGDIPISGRITHVADVFDAMTHPQMGRPPGHGDVAEAFIRAEAGRAFDPGVVAAFASVLSRQSVT
jgi:putative two-component system response regulator